jgi:hypothetical protein
MSSGTILNSPLIHRHMPQYLNQRCDATMTGDAHEDTKSAGCVRRVRSLLALVEIAKDFAWAAVARNLATTAAIVIGGAWAFSVFVLERGFAAHVQRQVKLKQIMDLPDGKLLVISICLHNRGRTRVRKESCQFLYRPITDRQLNLAGLSQVEASSEPRHALAHKDAGFSKDISGVQSLYIFNDLIGLEPGEDTEEDILLLLGNTPVLDQVVALEAEVKFNGRRGPFFRTVKTWASRGILDFRSETGSSGEGDANPRRG